MNLKISIHALREEGDGYHRRGAGRCYHFYPRPPRGGRPFGVHPVASLVGISPPPPPAPRPHSLLSLWLGFWIFLPPPSGWRATSRSLYWTICLRLFLSTPSARRATTRAAPKTAKEQISIHALREEGDTFNRFSTTSCTKFLSTPSARRATQCSHSNLHGTKKFLSTPSARRATLSGLPVLCCSVNFYPRPPRGGRLCLCCCDHPMIFVFLSTPSARRATGHSDDRGCVNAISIHALREEGDATHLCTQILALYFYPRPPRGGRRETGAMSVTPINISIHALREEGDLYSVPGLYKL